MVDIYESIYSYVKENLSKKRRKHSFEVSKLAESLCKRYDIEPDKGSIAGISHDIARDLDNSIMKEYALKDGKGISKWEYSSPILLYGRAGAEFIKEIWHVHDQDILDAVRYHTCGKPGMSLLSMILYVADYLEPRREFLDEDKRQEIIASEIEDMMIFVLKGKMLHLKQKGRTIHPDSCLLFEELCGKSKSSFFIEECNEKENI